MHDISQYGKHYAALQQRLGEAAPDKASDRLHFRNDHCCPNTARLGSGLNRLPRPLISDHVPAQIPPCILTDPAAIDIEAELGRALNENGASVGRAQYDHELK